MTDKDSPSSTNAVLVLGANGKTGSRVRTRLTALGVPVRAGSRHGEPPFDWNDRGTWAAALDGMHAVYLAYAPDLAMPGATAALETFTARAAAAGVRRVVMLSGRAEPEALECEEIVRDSGPEWTIARCAFFAQNFSEGIFAGELRTGTLTLPAGPVPEPFVHADDIADVAVAALTAAGHGGQVYELTGPRALSFAEAVAELGAACGRELSFTSVSRLDYIAALSMRGVPGAEISLLDYLFGVLLDGRNSRPADGVRRALGREPRDFAEYARDVAVSGVFSVTERGRSVGARAYN
ncbi:NAD(P)H-binding protein [Nocardia sp. NPDC005978]|uniref:NAD(P)H-binding protein n=1 Tax=Nocardia sp. NPDC005978 TaxID=3156725 RepID=UPI0033BEE8E1